MKKKIIFYLTGTIIRYVDVREGEDDDGYYNLIDRATMEIPSAAWGEAAEIEETAVADASDDQELSFVG